MKAARAVSGGEAALPAFLAAGFFSRTALGLGMTFDRGPSRSRSWGRYPLSGLGETPYTVAVSNREQSLPPRARTVEGVKRIPSVAAVLRGVGAGISARRYGADEVVFAQGEAADAVFYVRSGKVSLRAVSRGRAVTVTSFGRDTFFGEGCLSGESVRHATARASRPSAIVRIERRAMVALLRREAGFRALFTRHVLARHVRSEQELIDGLFVSSEKRLAGALLTMSGIRKTGGGVVSPGITEDGLALMLGARRADVRALMGRFRRRGLVTAVPGGLRVVAGLLGVVLRE